MTTKITEEAPEIDGVDFITETVHTLAGQLIVEAYLPVIRIVRLNDGSQRFECRRPGGGIVHVIR
jgi:hypothetical protein